MLLFFLVTCLIVILVLGNNDDLIIAVSNTNRARHIHAVTDCRYFLHNVQLNWHQAVEFCNVVGLKLATFNNEEDHSAFVDLIKEKHQNDLTVSYWTSGSDLGKKDKWVWLTTGKKLNYTNWYEGNPNHNFPDGEMGHCISISAAVEYKMINSRCSSEYYVACEVQAGNRKVQADNRKVQADTRKVQADNIKVQADNKEVQASNTEVQASTNEVQAGNNEVQASNNVQSNKSEILTTM